MHCSDLSFVVKDYIWREFYIFCRIFVSATVKVMYRKGECKTRFPEERLKYFRMDIC
jgi:hypothetical protein